MVATLTAESGYGPLCFTGHPDVMTLGAATSPDDSFGAEIVGDKLHGRSSSNIKASVAAFIAAASFIGDTPNFAASWSWSGRDFECRLLHPMHCAWADGRSVNSTSTANPLCSSSVHAPICTSTDLFVLISHENWCLGLP